MESGLEDRNNQAVPQTVRVGPWVSMESGLEDRNNFMVDLVKALEERVSMESGLEDRNNAWAWVRAVLWDACLNGVRPRRPEQLVGDWFALGGGVVGLNGVRPRRPEQFGGSSTISVLRWRVSMESGLEDRNNRHSYWELRGSGHCLNGVRPRRPEQ